MVRVWLVLLIGSAIIGALVAALVAIQSPPRYTSQVSMLVGPPIGGEINTNDIAVGQAMRQTFADLAGTRPILTKVIAATNVQTTPDELAGAIATRSPVNSSLLIVSVTWNDPAVAASLSNGVAQQLADYLDATGSDTASNVAITVVDPAVPPTRKDNVGPLFSAAIGGGIGIVFAICITFLVENLRPRGRREGQTA
jgi:capsular polysaccharide biosynthesis protein